MKKIYFLSVTFLISMVLPRFGLAQSLTQSFNEPVIGEVDKNYALDTSEYLTGLPTAITGSNVVWDFSKLKGKFPVIFDSIISPVGAPGTGSYTSATYAQKRGNITSYFKSSANPSQTEFLGAFTSSLSVTFTNSAIIAEYPVSYGYTGTDFVSGSFKYQNFSGGCNGYINIYADGLGTLIFPNGVTFQNVLRLRSVEQLTMSTGVQVGSISQSIYSYYVPGKKYPILTIQYQTYQTIIDPETKTALAYGNFDYFTVAGLQDPNGLTGVQVYPNPFTDVLNVISDGPSAIKSVSFHNVFGQLVYSTSLVNEIDYEKLPNGIYLLEVKTDRGSQYRKVVKR